MRKRFYFALNKRELYRSPVYLTEEDLLRGSRNKSVNEVTVYDFNYAQRTGMSMYMHGNKGYASNSRQIMNRADLILYTDRYGEEKRLKDRYGL